MWSDRSEPLWPVAGSGSSWPAWICNVSNLNPFLSDICIHPFPRSSCGTRSIHSIHISLLCIACYCTGDGIVCQSFFEYFPIKTVSILLHFPYNQKHKQEEQHDETMEFFIFPEFFAVSSAIRTVMERNCITGRWMCSPTPFTRRNRFTTMIFMKFCAVGNCGTSSNHFRV